MTSPIKHFLAMSGLCFVSLVQACKPSSVPSLHQHEIPHKRGLDENARRVQLGMRPVEETWMCFRSINGKDEWVADPLKDQGAIKTVRHDATGQPVYETDVYISGRKYLTIEDSMADEELRVGCDWKTGEIMIAYLGGERKLEKAVEALPRFSAETRKVYLELVKEVSKRWSQSKPK